MRFRRHLAWLPAAFLALAACGHSMPTTLHSLTAIPPVRTYGGYAGAPVRVDAVRLPPAIDRVEMLREAGAGRYTVLEFDRWAAAPARLARQALSEDLTLRLPAGAVIPSAGAPDVPAMAITVEILSFSTSRTGAVLTVNWTRGCRPGTGISHQSASIEALGGDTPTLLDSMLGQLADRIALNLVTAPQERCTAR